VAGHSVAFDAGAGCGSLIQRIEHDHRPHRKPGDRDDQFSRCPRISREHLSTREHLGTGIPRAVRAERLPAQRGGDLGDAALVCVHRGQVRILRGPVGRDPPQLLGRLAQPRMRGTHQHPQQRGLTHPGVTGDHPQPSATTVVAAGGVGEVVVAVHPRREAAQLVDATGETNPRQRVQPTAEALLIQRRVHEPCRFWLHRGGATAADSVGSPDWEKRQLRRGLPPGPLGHRAHDADRGGSCPLDCPLTRVL
jgi:hypothetical protein